METIEVDVDQETLDKLKEAFKKITFEEWCGQVMMLELYKRIHAEEEKDGDV